MSLVVLLQVLRPLESFGTDRASVRFMWDMNTNMGRDVVPLDGLCLAVGPVALEVQVVCRLATDVTVADMLLDRKLRSVTRSWLARNQDLPRVYSRRGSQDH